MQMDEGKDVVESVTERRVVRTLHSSHLYIGGLPEFVRKHTNTVTNSSLDGCILDLMFDK